MADLKQYSVLIVDDEEALRDAMVFDFQRKGFTVFSAENGAKAFEIVKSNKIHLVISDMRMPGGDGMSLLEQIRAYDPKMPQVIFVTGFSDLAEGMAIEKGARKILSKPFDRKLLMSSAFEALGVAGPAIF